MRTVIQLTFLLISFQAIFLHCQHCDYPVNNRIDCFPEQGATKEKCLERGCCWSPTRVNETHEFKNALSMSTPYCHFPSDYPSYRVVTGGLIGNYGYVASIEKKKPAGFRPKEILKLFVNVTFETDKRLRVRITDPNEARYEVPVLVERNDQNENNGLNVGDETDYKFVANEDPFFLKIYRKSTNKLIFDTSLGPLIYSDQFIQFSTTLPNKYFYGIGEHRDHFAHTTDWHSFTMWNRDVPPGLERNLYGDHPFYLSLEDTQHAMGFYFLNSNAMDINVQPAPGLTFTTIGGIIDFYLYLGPTPQEVISQHAQVVGRPFLPPYFSLGFHLCRWMYNNGSHLSEVIRRNRAAQMPYDVQWVDIDHMYQRLDWTYDPDRLSELPQIVSDLHTNGQHYVNIIDPAIAIRPGYEPYDNGLYRDVFIKESKSDKPLQGVVWPGPTVFPDFTKPNTSEWWADMAGKFHSKIPYDGIWIDMNEPSSFVDGSDKGCTNSSLDQPPYVPRVLDGQLYDKTICPSSRQHLSSHYNLHNMYGHFEAFATFRALEKIKPNKRPFVLTRSSFAGTGQYAAHWSGDNDANWDDLYFSIPNMLNFNMFAIPMVGSDICGFSGDTTEELCIRWMQLGSFYPFMRNHNNDQAVDQDPAVFSSHAQNIIRTALTTRYTLLPYLYTLFYKSYSKAETVVRPLFFEFMSDTNTHPIDRQFMFGPAILVSPVLASNTVTVDAYFPAETWFKYETGQMINETEGGYVKLDAPLEVINTHVRGGYILPYQMAGVTTAASRKNPFGILVALKKTDEDLDSAQGELFWDDGETLNSVETKKFNLLQFEASQKSGKYVRMGMVSVRSVYSGYTDETMVLGEIKVYGLGGRPTNVTIDGEVYNNYEYNEVFSTLKIQYFSREMNRDKPINFLWFF